MGVTSIFHCCLQAAGLEYHQVTLVLWEGGIACEGGTHSRAPVSGPWLNW